MVRWFLFFFVTLPFIRSHYPECTTKKWTDSNLDIFFRRGFHNLYQIIFRIYSVTSSCRHHTICLYLFLIQISCCSIICTLAIFIYSVCFEKKSGVHIYSTHRKEDSGARRSGVYEKGSEFSEICCSASDLCRKQTICFCSLLLLLFIVYCLDF